MIQSIITIAIVAAAVVIAAIKIYQNIQHKKDGCGGCTTDSCIGCPLEDLKQDIDSKNAKKGSTQTYNKHNIKSRLSGP
ncbi:MAG: FeoB-associated Cys-rich membrane protein [Bacteroidales bacterium]